MTPIEWSNHTEHRLVSCSFDSTVRVCSNALCPIFADQWQFYMASVFGSQPKFSTKLHLSYKEFNKNILDCLQTLQNPDESKYLDLHLFESSDIRNVCFTDPCMHQFGFSCLLDWNKVSLYLQISFRSTSVFTSYFLFSFLSVNKAESPLQANVYIDNS